MKTTTTNTADILAAMFTENTGRHMLDSGGAYGRNWERHAGKTVEAFTAAPTATADDYGVTVDAFHWLLDRVTYAPQLQEQLELFAAENPDEWGLALAEAFAGQYDDNPTTWNTYNYDNALSQTLQGVTFSIGGEVFTLLQIHGGCDVRGGYTEPKAFSVDVDMAEHFPYDVKNYDYHCTNDHEHSITVNGPDVIDWAGCTVQEPTAVGGVVSCPTCGAAMIVEAAGAY